MPTGQVKSKAVADGFDNVHDWLVFQATKESADTIAARKTNPSWLSQVVQQSTQKTADIDTNRPPFSSGSQPRVASAKSRHTGGVATELPPRPHQAGAQAGAQARTKVQMQKGGGKGSKGEGMALTCVDAVHVAIANSTPPTTAGKHVTAGLVQPPQLHPCYIPQAFASLPRLRLPSCGWQGPASQCPFLSRYTAFQGNSPG
jgi:hypothetical protein